ncbi:rhodanese-like domain-containing protein [Aquimarina agarivorans]|uniref:rhodanese-like domain-containing protein n=1 Tax=Aquimarina agarivorans TaxID=980584 RepID=UPI000248EB40|nr:rhodanese-like domain-containing protein [Aquimarina agarivorans]
MKNILLILVFITTTACFSQSSKSIHQIGFATLKNEIITSQIIQLVDVRTRDEFKNGYIDRAINIPIKNKEKFKHEVQHLNKNKPIYVYCHSGYRSRVASAILKDLNFKYIYNFSGGWKLWNQMIN